jgi:hypothetical protein
LRGYNALEAMRFDNGYIKQVVIGEAVILVGLGFASGARQLNPVVVSQRVSLAFGTVFGKCINSALLTLRKLRQAYPTHVF